MKKKLVVVLLGALIILLSPLISFAQQKYICIVDKAVGFKSSQNYAITTFKAGAKFIFEVDVNGSWFIKTDEVYIFNTESDDSSCKKPLKDKNGKREVLWCTNAFYNIFFNPINLRFSVSEDIGEYATKFTGNDTAISIGKCSKF